MDKQVNVYICQGALVPWRIMQQGRGRREEEAAILNGPGEGLAEGGPGAEIWRVQKEPCRRGGRGLRAEGMARAQC